MWTLVAGAAAFLMIVLLGVVLREALRRNDPLPYKPVGSLLSESELQFYRVLCKACEGLPVVIFTKVRLLDLMQIPGGTQERGRHRARVQSKHVDFVVCRAEDARPVIVVELDDPSHRQRRRRERDAFVDEVMRTISLPIAHIPTSGKYEIGPLQQMIRGRLTAPTRA
jgi:hypothetical protein